MNAIMLKMYLDNIQTVVLVIARELHIQMKDSKYCVCAWPTLFRETKVGQVVKSKYLMANVGIEPKTFA